MVVLPAALGSEFFIAVLASVLLSVAGIVARGLIRTLVRLAQSRLWDAEARRRGVSMARRRELLVAAALDDLAPTKEKAK